MTFISLLLQAIVNTNEMYAQDGQYKAVILTELYPYLTTVMIQFIDLSDGTECESYRVDISELEGPYTRKYEDAGGDVAYGSLSNMIVDQLVIQNVGTRLKNKV